jgi:hypothetical protein
MRNYDEDRERLFQQTWTSLPTPARRDSQPPDANPPATDAYVLLGLIVLCGVSVWLYFMPRTCLLSLCVFVGLAGVVWQGRRGSRRGVAGFLAGGVLAAGIVTLVVPGAWNEWSQLTGYQESERQAEALRGLAPLDFAGFSRQRGQRQALAGQFPRLLAPRLRLAEQDWLRRTCEALTEHLERLAADDPAGFDSLRKSQERLRGLLAPPPAAAAEALLATSLPEETLTALARAEGGWRERATDQLKDKLEKLATGDRTGFLALRQRAAELRPRMTDGRRYDATVAQASSAWAERSVRQVTDDLAKMPPNDMDVFLGKKDLRDLLRTEFPSLANAVGTTERSWAERSAAALVAQIEVLPVGNYDGLLQYRRSVQRLGAAFPDTSARLLEAEWAWAGRVVDDAVAKSQPLLETEPFKASAILREAAVHLGTAGFPALRPDIPLETLTGAPREVRDRLINTRRQAARAALTSSQRQARQLIKEDRYQAALAVAEQTVGKLDKEARALDLGDELTRFRETCAFLARLAREAGKEDPK